MMNHVPFPVLNSMGLPTSNLGFLGKQDLPNHLSILFRARPPLEYAIPLEKKAYRNYDLILDPNQKIMDKFEITKPFTKEKLLSYREIKLLKWKKKVVDTRIQQKAELNKYDPKENSEATGDPYKTVFLYNLNYETTAQKIKQVVEEFGKVKDVKLVVNKKTGKSKGYAFVEFERSEDFKKFYKKERIVIDAWKVKIDYERGRTKSNWRPMRLGGGRGGESRKDPEDEKQRVQVLIEEDEKIHESEIKDIDQLEAQMMKENQEDLKQFEKMMHLKEKYGQVNKIKTENGSTNKEIEENIDVHHENGIESAGNN